MRVPRPSPSKSPKASHEATPAQATITISAPVLRCPKEPLGARSQVSEGASEAAHDGEDRPFDGEDDEAREDEGRDAEAYDGGAARGLEDRPEKVRRVNVRGHAHGDVDREAEDRRGRHLAHELLPPALARDEELCEKEEAVRNDDPKAHGEVREPLHHVRKGTHRARALARAGDEGDAKRKGREAEKENEKANDLVLHISGVS